jgi:endoglucanase
MRIRSPDSTSVRALMRGVVRRGAPVSAVAAGVLFAGFTTRTSPAVSGSNPLAGAKLYVNPESQARQQAQAWRKSNPAAAARLERIGAQPEVIWLGDWNRDVRRDANDMATRITRAGAVPVFVAYNIPQRDCGSYSAGGAVSAAAYRAWIRGLAEGIGDRRAAVILEPDALAAMDCLAAGDREQRVALIREAVDVLKAKRGVAVYIDAGHGRWIGAADMAGRLDRAGIARADGFALNVSNFHTNAVNIAYGEQVSRAAGGKHFVIDTSRNGVGSRGDEWCNPKGMALGASPTTDTGHPLVDAFLWVKKPGESDGTCNGGPRAGQWWPEYALGLAERAAGIAVATN